MEIDKSSIVYSLSGSTGDIFDYLPYLFQDLWELGGGSDEIIELIERNCGILNPSAKVLELCCGKGAVLIKIIHKFNCIGKGIDLFEPFINDAVEKAKEYDLSNQIDFEVMDIKDAVNNFRNYDIVIYGSDTNILGDESESLRKITNCCNPNGYLVYETVIKSEKDELKFTKELGLKIIDKQIAQPDEIRKMNDFINQKLIRRAEELIEKFPNQKKLFEEYIAAQKKESFELENNLILVRFLLQLN
jgi:cyclopropane fatty-acyl-phospholipid synthase-like methyltransferase